MKKLILIGLVIILSAPAFSQIKFGIKAGAETTTVPSYQLGEGDATINALKDASWGYHAGIFLDLILALYIFNLKQCLLLLLLIIMYPQQLCPN